MKFIHDDFLLETPQARRLYHEYAAPQPIIDYHCHLPPSEIAENKRWSDIAALWLGADHYKWRAMRAVGIDERFCTGDATPWEKFSKYAEAMPQFLRNPLYHWSHLELARYFGVDDLLSPATAQKIFDHCNEKLTQPECSARGFMERSKVETVCTTDDPVDSLEYHRAISADKTFAIRVLPTWRPDKALLIDRLETFSQWLGALEQAAGKCNMSVSTFQRRWNESMGITPARYALGLKLQEACRLLIETSNSISEVANACGFDDEFYFSRCFRRQFGSPPRTYRKEHLIRSGRAR